MHKWRGIFVTVKAIFAGILCVLQEYQSANYPSDAAAVLCGAALSVAVIARLTEALSAVLYRAGRAMADARHNAARGRAKNVKFVVDI